MTRSVLFVCESYYLKFYKPLADRLSHSGFNPIWVSLDGDAQWPSAYLDPSSAIEGLAEVGDFNCASEQIDALCAFERAVFEGPQLFKDNYHYTLTTVRTADRARQLAAAWYQFSLALLLRFRPSAVFLWNGRYLPYSAVSSACAAARQLFLTSEIGWIPGTIFADRGALSTDTTDLAGRHFGPIAAADAARADAFLNDYRARKATMVSQTLGSPSEVRRQLLGDGKFVLLYGCQVDWDTNVVIGARRFRTNESAVAFLIECADAVPGARIVVKTHPLDSQKAEDRLREMVGSRGTVVSDVHPHTLIEAADCVAVRNSTLGFEAICYGKPVVVLENAKYRHPGLTMDAANVGDTTSHLLSVAANRCDLPDRETLQQFVLHLVDHYLMPISYEYFFDPAKLELLSHFAHSDSYRTLEQLLNQVPSRAVVEVADAAVHAVDTCELRQPHRRSFLRERLRGLADWIT
jgi:Capsule polysaccharide biosynthesis protein